MPRKISLKPQPTGLWHIVGGGFDNILQHSHDLEYDGEWEQACEVRLEGVEQILNALDEEEQYTLDWNDRESRAAMELLYLSATDHLSIGEVETAATLWEQLVELDEEDRTEAMTMLAFCYIALEDWECLEAAMFDVSTKSPEYHLLSLWETFRRTGGIEQNALRELRTRHKEWWREFTAEEHPADEKYLAECQSDRPSQTTQARQLWFATATLWAQDKDFLKKVK